MKKILLAHFLLWLFLQGFAQTNPIQIQDTMLGTAQTWRDTCFGLLDKSTTWVPSGYLLDYSLADLNVGSYVVTILDGKEWSSEKLLIQR